MKLDPVFRRRRLAFTLVELLVVIAIIALLAGLATPAYHRAIQSAQSVKCAGNLRAIGVAISQAATDNDNEYPAISQAATSPYPPGSNARDLYDTLSPYGVTSNTLECPTDINSGTTSAFKQYGSSYEWNPAFDDEVTVTPILYFSPTIQIPVNNSKVHLCFDFNPIHFGRPNYLYGDGHVRAHN
jgi:prepilin-type N-terminal cleavage/methylation domain-containing protein/prepilin-type processing-associated H-X9-DG protein